MTTDLPVAGMAARHREAPLLLITDQCGHVDSHGQEQDVLLGRQTRRCGHLRHDGSRRWINGEDVDSGWGSIEERRRRLGRARPCTDRQLSRQEMLRKESAVTLVYMGHGNRRTC